MREEEGMRREGRGGNGRGRGGGHGRGRGGGHGRGGEEECREKAIEAKE